MFLWFTKREREGVGVVHTTFFKTHTHIKCFQLNREEEEKMKQHEHFPPLDLCDFITLNILSPEQARLHSNHRSQP